MRDVQKELNLLIDKSEMSEEELLTQIKEEFNRSEIYVSSIRKEFEYEDRQCNNEKDNKELLGDFTTYAVHNAYMAREYSETVDRKFSPSRTSGFEIISHLNNVLHSDFNEEDMEVELFQFRSNKNRRGVGIEVETGWDGVNKKPIIKNIDPRNWYPDPAGGFFSGNWAYMGFNAIEYISNLPKEFLRRDEITNMKSSDGAMDNAITDKRAAGMNVDDELSNSNNEPTEIYYHYGTFNGVKAIVTTANNNAFIVDVQIIKAVTARERKFPAEIRHRTAFAYFDPEDAKPFGNTRIPLLCKDTQKAKSMMLNLRLKKSQAELLPMYFVDTNKIPNASDLEFGMNKVVSLSLEPGENINNVVAPMQKDFRFDSTNQMDAIVDSNLEKATSIGKVAQGSEPGRRDAATTQKLIQGNTDINLLYTAKKYSFGEKQLVRMWLYGYLANFKSGDKKSAFVYKAGSMFPREFSKEEFLGEEGNVKILIESSLEIEERKNKIRIDLAQLGQSLEGVNRTEAEKREYYRLLAQNSHLTEEQITGILQPTIQELKAGRENEALMDGIEMKVATDDDDAVHLLIHRVLDNSDISMGHRMKHEQQLRFKQKQNPELNQEGLTGVDKSVTRATQAQNAASIQGQAQQINSPLNIN